MTRSGCGGLPRPPGRPPGRVADQQPRVVGADRAGADQDGVGADAQRVHLVQVLRAGEDQAVCRASSRQPSRETAQLTIVYGRGGHGAYGNEDTGAAGTDGPHGLRAGG